MFDLPNIVGTKDLLQTYFESDEERRFKFAGMHASGTTANTWKVTYWPRNGAFLGNPQYLILKTENPIMSTYSAGSYKTPSHAWRTKDSIRNERKYLKILEHASHIGKMAQVPGDPLKGVNVLTRDEYLPDWVYLEWIEYGSLKQFMDRAREEFDSLPNRLLWRLFGCLVRMCIAMAYPPLGPEDWDNPRPVIERIRGMQPTGIIHEDIHPGNLLFGDLENPFENREHDNIPPLKLIDFGDARNLNDPNERIEYYNKIWRAGRPRSDDDMEEDPAVDREGDIVMPDASRPKIYDDDSFTILNEQEPMGDDRGIAKNIYAIGETMMRLFFISGNHITIPLGHHLRRSQTVGFRMPEGGQVIETTAFELATTDPATGQQRLPALDPELRALVCACTAANPAQRPNLGDLADVVFSEMERRDLRFYLDMDSRAGRPFDMVTESDGNIQNIVQDLIFNAPVLSDDDEVTSFESPVSVNGFGLSGSDIIT